MKANAQKLPSFIEPMKALPVEKLPEGDWIYEIKHDGYQALAFKEGKEVRLISRNNRPLNYPRLLDSLKLLAVEQVILDGEIVALDERGRSSFQLLQDYKSSEQRVPLVYYIFDLLFVDGKDLADYILPLAKSPAGSFEAKTTEYRHREGGRKSDELIFVRHT